MLLSTERTAQKAFSTNKAKSAFFDLGLAQKAWAAVLMDPGNRPLTVTPLGPEQRPRISNSAKNSRSFRFNDVTMESVGMDDVGVVVLVMRSPRPKDTVRGFEMYQSQIAHVLWKFYGCKAKLALHSNKKRGAELLKRTNAGTAYQLSAM